MYSKGELVEDDQGCEYHKIQGMNRVWLINCVVREKSEAFERG